MLIFFIFFFHYYLFKHIIHDPQSSVTTTRIMPYFRTRTRDKKKQSPDGETLVTRLG